MTYTDSINSGKFHDSLPDPTAVPLHVSGTSIDPTQLPEIEEEITNGQKDQIAIRYAQHIREQQRGVNVRESIARFSLWLDVKQNTLLASHNVLAGRQDHLEERYDTQLAGSTDISEVIDSRVALGGTTFPTLKSRLDSAEGSTRSELARLDRVKADQAFVDAQFASIISGSPTETFMTYAILVKTYPKGKPGVMLVLEDGHWYYWNQVTGKWTDGGAYQSATINNGTVEFKHLKNLKWGIIFNGVVQYDTSEHTMRFSDTNITMPGSNFHSVPGTITLYNVGQTNPNAVSYIMYDAQAKTYAEISDPSLLDQTQVLIATLFQRRIYTFGGDQFNSRAVWQIDGRGKNVFTNDMLDFDIRPTALANNFNCDLANNKFNYSLTLAIGNVAVVTSGAIDYDFKAHEREYVAVVYNLYTTKLDIRSLSATNNRKPNEFLLGYIRIANVANLTVSYSDFAEPFAGRINGYEVVPNKVASLAIKDNLDTQPLFKDNLFNKDTVVRGKYRSFNTGIWENQAGYVQSHNIKVDPTKTRLITRTAINQIIFLDSYDRPISGAASPGLSVEIPAGTAYFSVSVAESQLDTFQITYDTETIGQYKDGSFRRTEKLQTYKHPDIAISSNITMLVNEPYSIYYRNIIVGHDYLPDSTEVHLKIKRGTGAFIPLQEENADILPDHVSLTFTRAEKVVLQIAVFDIFAGAYVNTKDVTINVVDPALSTNKSPTIVTMGDSFTDGHGVSTHMYNFLVESGYTPNMIGQNATETPAARDDAASGWGYINFTTVKDAPLRYDRPLWDAYWDAGWGENEIYGWKTGQEYADLTVEQRSHGRTRNQFWNPDTGAFDFTYYMKRYYPDGQKVDYVISFMGLNDTIWGEGYKNPAVFNNVINKVKEVVASIHKYDPSIKILLGTVTPQNKQDTFMAQQTGAGSLQSKLNQELWNKLLIDTYDNGKVKNVHILDTAAQFDAKYGLRAVSVPGCKYKADYNVTKIMDVHPNAVGSKQIGDTGRNGIIGIK